MAAPRVAHWNGKDVPDELRDPPAGTYVLEPIDTAPGLTPEEEAGLRTVIASVDAGRGIAIDDMRGRIDAILRR